MSQPLPLSPQLPSLDSRLSVPRDRPMDNGERSAQRHSFDRLLDRFTQSDQGPDQTKDTATAPQGQPPRERASATDDSPHPTDDAVDDFDTGSKDALAAPTAPSHHAAAPADPAKPAPEAVPTPNNPAPIAVDVQAIVPVVSTAPAVPTATMPITTDAAPAAAAAVSAVAAAMPAVAPSPIVPANDPMPVAGVPAAAIPTAKAAAAPAEPATEGAAPEASTDMFALGQAAVPAARSRRTIVANGATEPAAKAAAAASAAKAAPATAAPQADRLPAARPEVDPTAAAANSNQPVPQVRIVKVEANVAAVDTATLAAAHEEHDAAQSSADQAVAGLTSLDSPRRTAALYHKVADAAKPGADTPTPADQISIRLIHAVAEGKRAIQMHLHPAELGSIEVKMQWQGDKLTAQFTVDRPETLQLLQREVPALERSLGQAGVNVDSGSLSFSLRQQQGNGKNGGEGFGQAAANAGFGDAGNPTAGEETLGQVIRDGILSIRV